VSAARAAALLAGLVALGPGAATARADITGVRVEHQASYAGGASLGTAGPYVEIRGVARGELDPADPRHAGIADLALAPRNARGRVEYEIDFHILRPADPALASATVIYDVTNRGMRVLLPLLHDAALSGSAGEAAERGNGFAFGRGYTLVWSGWDPMVPQGLRARLPVATQAGAPLRGGVRDEFVAGSLRGAPAPPRLSYALADPASVRVAGRGREGDRRVALPPDAWQIADGVLRLRPAPGAGLHPAPGALEPGFIYDVWYTARDPWVLGVGFAATRDWVAFLRREAGDAERPNPLARAQPYASVLATGISQSGRFLRHFLELGMNRDAEGRRVFDGMLIHVAGIGKVFANHRFGQPARTAGQHSDRHYPENWFPFAHASLRDPVAGRIGGLWRGDDSDPRILEVNTGTEYWHKGASLLHTDALAQRDVEAPDSVRHYLIAGMEHASGLAYQPTEGLCANATNSHHGGPVIRALLAALEAWVARGTPPPDSQVPLLGDGTLVSVDQLRFPPIPGLAVAQRANAIGLPVDWVDPPATDPPGGYAVRVPAVDADGNERTGVRLPPIAAPLGTYTPWNVLRDPALAPDLCGRFGSFAPFSATRAEREARGDPRPSLQERYPTRADYVRRVQSAAASLVDARLLLPQDARAYVEKARAQAGPWP
jgi:hypothetical protein